MHHLQVRSEMVFHKATGEWRAKRYEIGPEPLSPNEDVTLAAMRLALTKPRPLSEQESIAHQLFRRTANIAVYATERLWRRGKLVYRREGRAGADLSMPPVEWDARHALAVFLAKIAKGFRRPSNSLPAVRSRQATAAKRAAPVIALLEAYAPRGRGRAALIARRLNLPVAYVRRVIRESVRDANL